jgi:hypothetical protein
MLNFIEEFLFWFVLMPILAIVIFLGGLLILDEINKEPKREKVSHTISL